jgi:hypothetical protein
MSRKPGQILMSPAVEPVGDFELKGIKRPLAAYNVVGAVSAGSDQ